MKQMRWRVRTHYALKATKTLPGGRWTYQDSDNTPDAPYLAATATEAILKHRRFLGVYERDPTKGAVGRHVESWGASEILEGPY